MSRVSVFDHAWIDLVFEGRNQKYGAYQLRRQDSKTTMLALFSGIGLMVALVSVPTVINYFSPAPQVADVVPSGPVVEITPADFVPPAYEAPKPEPVIPDTPTQAAAAPTSPTPTTEFNHIVATSDPVEIHTTTAILNTAPPAATTNPGDGSGNFTTNPTGNTPGGTGTNVNATATTGNAIETSVDVMPEYPGGIERFYSEVGGKFRTPDYDGTTAKVYVSFVVEKDGSMSNIKVTRDACKCLGPEALRVLNSIKTKWTPGKKKGVAVRTAYNLPITVNLQ